MPNTSATGGYLLSATDPLDDEALEDFLHDVIAGITALPGTMVRPRWQPEGANLTPYGTNWVGFGVMRTTSDLNAYMDLDPADGVSYRQIRNEVMDVMCSFYGPNADKFGRRLRDGLQIAQNREALYLAGIALVAAGELTAAPELVKERWLNRSDLTVTLRREIRRVYPVLTFLSAAGVIVTDTNPQLTRTFDVEPS